MLVYEALKGDLLMKAYSISDEERENFILRFEEKGDHLLVYYADYKAIPVDNSQKQKIIKKWNSK